MIWLRMAYLTSSLIEWTSSLAMIRARCVSAVFGLMRSASATSLLARPSARTAGPRVRVRSGRASGDVAPDRRPTHGVQQLAPLVQK